MEDTEKEISDFIAIEPLAKSIENIKNISIEHAYSEEIDSNDKHEHLIDESSLDIVPIELDEQSDEENTGQCNELATPTLIQTQTATPTSTPTPTPTPTVESKQEFTLEQVAEKVKSRELKSLLDAAKESNLDTNIIHKRESRKSFDPYGTKTSNDNYEFSGKRTMRSQNPDFLVKQQKFLHKVNKFEGNSDGAVVDNDNQTPKKEKDVSLKRKKDAFGDGQMDSDEHKKNRKTLKNEVVNTIKNGKDSFCWRCHRDGVMVHCETCPRAYHIRCLKQPVSNPERWPCPECLAILQAESTKTRSAAMREMSLEHLCELLKYAVKRMIGCAGSEPFIHPVDLKIFPDYRNYVVQPMDLTTLESNIRNNVYGSTVAFMADAKWILHNSIIYNSYQSKLTTAAKSITKICKQEMSEIETCSECYQNANTKKNSWFVEVCPKPHILLWAKLKGFPYWPAKAMTTNSAGLVDVRFFGAHDRAWIPVKECFLYSKKDPNTTNKHKRNNIAECVKEIDIHIEKLRKAYGEFCHAPYRTLYDPNSEAEQLRFMLPKYKLGLKMKAPVCNVKNAKESEDKEKYKIKVFKSSSQDSLESRDDSFQKNSDSTVSLNDISDSRIRSDASEDMDVLSSSSKASLLNNDDNVDKNIKFSTQDFDKFMEGYGTEDDETTALTLNDEIRKKMIQYESDSGEESGTSKNHSNPKDAETKEDSSNYNSNSSPEKVPSEIAPKTKASMLTPENYSKVSGKVRIVRSRKRNLPNAHNEFESPNKMQRRNSDISTTSDSSRISCLSDKISRVEEFSETLEVSLANTSKDSAVVSFSENISPEKKGSPESTDNTDKTDNCNMEQADLINLKPVVQVCTGDLFNKNKDLKISPLSKSVSIADRLMKKISANEVDKVEAVKKQILDNLETNSSTSAQAAQITQATQLGLSSENQTNNDLVSSSNNDKEQRGNDKNATATATSNSTDKKSECPNVSSSTESLNSDAAAPGNLNNKTVIAADKTTQLESKEVNKESASRARTRTRTRTDVISDESESSGDEEDSDSESEQSIIGEKNMDNSHVKLVNVSDILSGKINGNASIESVRNNKCEDVVEVKNEPLSDDDDMEIEKDSGQGTTTNRTVSSDDDAMEKQAEIEKESQPFKVVDNLTRVIDSVATDYNTPLALNKKELSLRPISKLMHSPKQRARKSFPNSPYHMHHISMVTSSMKKVMAEKKPMQNPNVRPVSTLQHIQPHIVTTSSTSSNNNTNNNSGSGSGSGSNSNISNPQEGMLYITPQQTPVINNMALLPPNQPITLTTQNVGSPILAMVQHHGISTPSLIIQQNQQNSSLSTSVSQCSIVAPLTITTSSAVSTGAIGSTGTGGNTSATSTPSISTSVLSFPLIQTTEQNTNSNSVISEDRSGISEQITKAVGDLFCRPPPVLKPRPPGPLSTYFDEGLPSSAGPTTKLVNSISHRLSDYFRGLLVESFRDLSTIESPEAKIRSLELEIETLKHKHKEEMVELRKNISSVLKDIQKSIIEDKAKIVDETRIACEAERLRCIEETKSKQWCAFCLKEAQFYCCWNTSYCDYPCQQKHWPAHMNTCSQARNAPSGANSADKSQINAAASKLTKAVNSNNNKTMIKPARMIVKQTSKGVPMYVPVQRSLQAGQQTLTLVESTPGNFEIVGNHGPISLGGKIVPTTTIKVKPGNVITVASSSSNNTSLSTAGTSKTIILSQKAPQIIHKSSPENKT